MRNVNAFTCVYARRYAITSFIALYGIATIIIYNIYFAQPSYMPHVWHQQGTWSKTNMKVSRRTETPPWLLLLAHYNSTIMSGRNLYVWPELRRINRLGNRLFAYAAMFGIAWRNRRIPIWPENNAYDTSDITKFFNLRIPVDRNNTIIHVSLISYFK